ncbi:uncharacterized protein LOC116337362 [Contarinia nasturtii]|uniref:uncharacterized protein LOC116337362 n=1 Tax=Contarinia nasturtii TaxID=265458 RepID=UPI0012D49149|nr:uncharacterized protein LOC116337362 [Contarinia nasturtii]
MSLQRIAIISAVSSHGIMRNRTVYYERQQNETNFDRGINLQQHFNVFIGGAFLSFAITLLCVVCYCFNKIINKNSMALYRRHLMEAANNQNVDIYTVEQFYETEAFAPLCDTQSAQSVLPPSYDDVMAAEKAILNKYAKMCTSTKCCEHSQLNRSNADRSSTDDGTNINDNIAENSTATGNDGKPDANNQTTDGNAYDDNGNEITSYQGSMSSICCVLDHANDENTCRAQKVCSCVDNCSVHCNNISSETMDTNANPSTQEEENGNNSATSTDENNTLDANNNAERLEMHSGRCQCTHQRHRDSPVEFNVLSDNGIVRMDMSKIIDRTGLPTYDAAIKLESFGYV